MPILEAVLIAVAVLALLGVIFEEVIHVNKAKTTLFFGTLSWVLLFLFSSGADETTAVSTGLLESIAEIAGLWLDRKSTRLNSSHVKISYAVFCLKKK